MLKGRADASDADGSCNSVLNGPRNRSYNMGSVSHDWRLET